MKDTRIRAAAVAVAVGAAIGAVGLPAGAQSFTDNFNSINAAWITDRYEPDDFSSQFFDGDNRLHIGISTADALHLRPGPYQSTFYNTQGRQRIVNNGTVSWTVSADVYVSADMTSGANLRRTDLWARTGLIGNETGAKYPIFGLRRFDPLDPFNTGAAAITSVWRVWDDDTINGWVELGAAVTTGWHNLKIVANGSSYRYYIDNVLQYTDTSVNSLPLTTAFLQAYNFGQSLAQPGQNYSAYWDNLNVALSTLSLQANSTCYGTGDTVTVRVNMSNQSQNIVGGQFFLGYDSTKLTFLTASVGDAPFTNEVYRCTPTDPMAGSCVPLVGRIDYATGVPLEFPPNQGTAANTTMAILTFTAAAEICDADGLVYWRDSQPFPPDPPSRLTNATGGSTIPLLEELSTLSIDNTAPSITCPGPVTVYCGQQSDPPATGVAIATDCSPYTITYNDDRSGLVNCNATGTILRTWTATDCAGNVNNCVQVITMSDDTPPIMTACPNDITINADAGFCSAIVNYTSPTAVDSCYFEGFEDPQFDSGTAITTPSVNWNDYNSALTRVASGTDGIPSKSGGFHGYVDSTTLPAPPDDWTGLFSRLRGYSSVWGTGFKTSVDVYINLADPKVAANTYGFDISTAVNNQAGNHRRDFIFHAAADSSDAVNTVYIGGSNNSNFAPRQDLDTLGNNYEITASGWYTFEWNFRNNGGVLAVDLILRDALGTQLFIETRQDNSDLIATIVGGNRYMWFTFIEADKLAIDNTSLIRNVPVVCVAASGSVFATGVNTVTCTATDACGNDTDCEFDITISGYNELVVDVQYAGGGWPALMQRGITFELWDCPGTMTPVCDDLMFATGLAANAVVLIPCGSYDCITARDELHSLRRTASYFTTVGTQYEADFSNATSKSLIGGNLNDDFYIDILDFGIFAGQYLSAQPVNTNCSTPPNHADISGNGTVFNEDFTFIQQNFLKTHDANCCGAPGFAGVVVGDMGSRTAGPTPTVSIAVKQLYRQGLGHLAVADLNHDGWLDQSDVAAFMSGVTP